VMRFPVEKDLIQSNYSPHKLTSMKEHLEKRKRSGIIDFIEVPLSYGRKNKEFIGFDLQNKYFFRIFFDNKYREDTVDSDALLTRLKIEQKEHEKGKDNRGIYNTKVEFDMVSEQINFIENYK
jgi:hypothetical protein